MFSNIIVVCSLKSMCMPSFVDYFHVFVEKHGSPLLVASYDKKIMLYTILITFRWSNVTPAMPISIKGTARGK